jgi:hypothetical protein
LFGFYPVERASENGIVIVMTEYIGSELANLKLRYKSASFALILLGTPSITDHVDTPGVVLGATITSSLVGVPSYLSIASDMPVLAYELIELTKLGFDAKLDVPILAGPPKSVNIKVKVVATGTDVKY